MSRRHIALLLSLASLSISACTNPTAPPSEDEPADQITMGSGLRSQITMGTGLRGSSDKGGPEVRGAQITMGTGL